MSSQHVYDYEVDLDSDSAPARVIRMAGRGKRVLEIGAGPGSITRHLSGTNGCDVVAAELDPAAIEILKAHTKAIYPLDLNDPNWPSKLEKEGKFDVVIAADVLEHLYDPASVLKSMVSLLNDTGSIVLSLPHVSHCAIHACLLDEDFCYRDWGLLDKTHIRFFGLKNIEALHAQAGLSLVEAQFVVRLPDQTEFAERWNQLPANLRTGLLNANRHSLIYQVVTRASRTAQVAQPISLMDVPVESPSLPQVIGHRFTSRAKTFARTYVPPAIREPLEQRLKRLLGRTP